MLFNESRVDLAQRFSKIWYQSRHDAGKSQEFMALGLGVSKKTVQNWERGISSPTMLQGVEWFQLLGMNPMCYFLVFLYPEYFDTLGTDSDDADIEQILMDRIRHSSSKERKQLLFLISGIHGSSWISLLQMMTAHCHTSMHSRVVAARTVLENFEIEEKTGSLVCPDNVMPDINMLKSAIFYGKTAAENNQTGYTTNTNS